MVSAVIANRLENLAISQDHEHYRQGILLFNRGEYERAWDAFNEAIQLNPNKRIYFVMRGSSSTNLGHYESALSDYDMAMNFPMNDRERGLLYSDLAVLYLKMGDEQTAYSHLATAARLGNGIAQNLCRYYGIPF